MKKTIPWRAAVAVLAVLLLVPALCAAEEAVYPTAGDLYEAWYTENPDEVYPYPACVAGVWSTDGGLTDLTFLILPGHADEAEAAVTDRVADKGTVTLVTGGAYAISELAAAQQGISERMMAGAGSYPVFGCGIDERANRVTVDINMELTGAEEAVSELTAAYGEMLVFENGLGVSVDTTAASSPYPVLRTVFLWVLEGVVAASLAAFCVLFFRQHRKK